MTSKEALEKKIKSLEEAIDIAYQFDDGSALKECLSVLELYNTILKDLELFEKCKNENSDYQIKFAELQDKYVELKDKYDDLYYDFKMLNDSNRKLDRENEKLKQVLDILKRANLEYDGNYLVINDRTAIRIDFTEYEILKEVLGNE